jgi:hypothetical protein
MPTMLVKTWEYCILEVSLQKTHDIENYNIFALSLTTDGDKKNLNYHVMNTDYDKESIHNGIAQLGGEGWELIFMEVDSDNLPTYFFKKMVEEEVEI